MSVWIDVDEAIARTRRGEILIIVDDADRENEGDMFVAAAHASPEALNTFITHARGLVCVPMTGERLDRLDLPAMVRTNTSLHGTAFTVPVDARFGTTTGISAYDRARTVKSLLDPATGPDDLLRPGHVFPLRAAPGGVLERAGHTEAAVELALLAGLPPAGVICEVVRDDGSMARVVDLEQLAERLGMGIVSVAQIVAYKRGAFDVVERSRAKLPAHEAEFEVHDFEDLRSGEHHLALTLGDTDGPEPLLIRVHSECLTGDVFGSRRCDCGEQLERALEAIAREGRGAILYLRQEGRGIGLPAKLRAYELQDLGLDTVEANVHQGFPADARDFTVAARMLRHLGVERVRLMTNNPAKSRALKTGGVDVERVPLVVHPNRYNGGYLHAKRTKLGHELPIEEDGLSSQTEEVAAVARPR